MADTAKANKKSLGTKIANFFKKIPSKLAAPFKNMWRELKKVTWPTKQELIRYSLIVMAFLVFMGIVVGLLDLGSTALVKLFV